MVTVEKKKRYSEKRGSTYCWFIGLYLRSFNDGQIAFINVFKEEKKGKIKRRVEDKEVNSANIEGVTAFQEIISK